MKQSYHLPTTVDRQSGYDVIVVGAGPAGASVSILLAEQGLRVLLLEKSRFPREKLCGEFLSPESLTIFDRLGVRESLLHAGAHPIYHWTIIAPDGKCIEIPLSWISRSQAHAIGISRARMDLLLLDRAREMGVIVREGVQVSARIHRQRDYAEIEGRENAQQPEQFAARLIVDASGRGSAFSARSATPTAAINKGSRAFGVKVHLRGIRGLDHSGELYFFRDGYGGMSNVEGERTNLCFITSEETLRASKGDRQALLERTLLTNPAARERLRDFTVDGEWLGTGPIHYGRRPAHPDVLAIGDAGAFIDPFTGSGMLLALKSGELAASVITQAFARHEYNLETITGNYQQVHRQQFGLRFQTCAMLRRLAFRPASRNLMATLLSRHRLLARLVTISTRQ
jgi:flavin-dependent dehydrogenase